MASIYYRRRHHQSSQVPILEVTKDLAPSLLEASNMVMNEPTELKEDIKEADNKGKENAEEEVKEDEANQDDADSEEEETESDREEDDVKETTRKLSRSEKKSRKALLKLGFKHVPGANHCIVMQKAKNVMYDISEATVYQNSTSEKYVIFGKTTTVRLNPETSSSNDSTGVIDKDDEEEVDVSELDPRDIELVMTQTNLSWTDAAKALKEANNDIVTAIMDHNMENLTMN